VSGGQARLDGQAVAELSALGSELDVVVHGTGLSIASYDGWWDGYLHLLDELLERVPARWHSEHLGYTRVNGEFLGTMLPVPRTEQMLDLLVDRVTAIQERYALPFLLENVVHLLPDYPAEYSEAAFLNALTHATGCGLLLDVYNLRCDEANYGFDVAAFLDELDLDAVVEVHVAGGVEHGGFTLDVHSRETQDETLQLAVTTLSRAPNVGLVTYELLDEAVPPLRDRITGELRRVREAVLPPVPAARVQP